MMHEADKPKAHMAVFKEVIASLNFSVLACASQLSLMYIFLFFIL